MLTQEQEARRSLEWKIVMTVSSIVIIVIAVLFLVRMFHSNPLEGTWVNEENDITMQIDGGGSVVMGVSEYADGDVIQLDMKYTIDLDEKTIFIEENSEAFQKAAEASDGAYSEEDLKNQVDDLMGSFEYSVDQEELTLTERDYGEQFTFIKQ